MSAKIINRGRGPEIAGTRITIYDVLDYAREGWRPEHIAGLFRLPLDDIHAALRYIEDHAEATHAEYERMLARHRDAQYSPEVQTKLAQNRKRLQERLAILQAELAEEESHAGAPR